MEMYDVVIIGAGPAGISTALHLECLAPHLVERTLIIEKARHPRPKLCGGGILHDGLVILKALGLDGTQLPLFRVSRAHFTFQGYETVFSSQPERALHIIRREPLDAWLADAARKRGFTIHEEEPARQIIPGERFVEVVTSRNTYRARVVVGADGAHSLVRRTIAGNFRLPYSRALVLWVPPSEKSSHHPEDAYFDFTCMTQDIPGYVWDFPIIMDGQVMRCWGITDNNIGPHYPQRLRPFLAAEMARHGYRMEDHPLYGESVPHFSPQNAFSAPHILLVGDAIGVDVLYGEGIAPALEYGRLAAEAIVDAGERNDFSFRNYRQRVLQSEMGKALRRRAAFAKTFFRLRSPVIQRWIWGRLSALVRWSTERFLVNWASGEPRGTIRTRNLGSHSEKW